MNLLKRIYDFLFGGFKYEGTNEDMKIKIVYCDGTNQTVTIEKGCWNVSQSIDFIANGKEYEYYEEID